MMRGLLSFGVCGCAFCAVLGMPTAAGAEELPMRKAGLWEMKIVRPARSCRT